MINKLIEKLTGKDDLERVAYKDDLNKLNACLKIRKVLVPRRPRRFLDAKTFTQEQLIEQIRKDAQELSSEPFEPWILELGGKKRLPVFSSLQKAQDFASRISKDMNMVFGLGYAEFLVEEVSKNLEIDFIDLNLFSQKSWEIAVRKLRV